MTKTKEDIRNQTIELLQKLIGVSSFSKEEDQAADIIRKFLKAKKIPFETKLNNTWVKNKHYNFLKPTILLEGISVTMLQNPCIFLFTIQDLPFVKTKKSHFKKLA